MKRTCLKRKDLLQRAGILIHLDFTPTVQSCITNKAAVGTILCKREEPDQTDMTKLWLHAEPSVLVLVAGGCVADPSANVQL